jgi:rRNA maturation endonuclease Nob1
MSWQDIEIKSVEELKDSYQAKYDESNRKYTELKTTFDMKVDKIREDIMKMIQEKLNKYEDMIDYTNYDKGKSIEIKDADIQKSMFMHTSIDFQMQKMYKNIYDDNYNSLIHHVLGPIFTKIRELNYSIKYYEHSHLLIWWE